jgi:UDP-GlcNAc3NAcA epimerase
MATPLASRSTVLDRLGLTEKMYGVATFHRQENLASTSRMEMIIRYLRSEARIRPLIIPLHPRTSEALATAGLTFDCDDIITMPPLGYFDMCQLTRSAAVVLTDSGGLQREAYFYRVPCITLRDETEWMETVEFGWNRLWTVEQFAPRREVPDYESARAAEAILEILDREIPLRERSSG